MFISSACVCVGMSRTILNTKKVRITTEKETDGTRVRIYFNGKYVLAISTNDEYNTIQPSATVFNELKYTELEGYAHIAGGLELGTEEQSS